MMYQVGQRVPEFRGRDGVFLSIDGSGVFLLQIITTIRKLKGTSKNLLPPICTASSSVISPKIS